MKRFFLLALVTCALGSGQITAAEKNPVVVMETSKGTIKIELFADKAPITVNNFLSYVNDKFYDGLVFHRVIKGFMIQGGGVQAGGREKRAGLKNPIKNESNNGLENKRGTIAMARTGDPDSATAQFFINHKDNAFLDKERARDGVGYCVFGKVIDGMDVVDKIADVNVRTDGVDHVPSDDVVIKSVRVEK